jgi:hypothetical protein
LWNRNGFAINAAMKQQKSRRIKTQFVMLVVKADFKDGINVNVASGFIPIG